VQLRLELVLGRRLDAVHRAGAALPDTHRRDARRIRRPAHVGVVGVAFRAVLAERLLAAGRHLAQMEVVVLDEGDPLLVGRNALHGLLGRRPDRCRHRHGSIDDRAVRRRRGLVEAQAGADPVGHPPDVSGEGVLGTLLTGPDAPVALAPAALVDPEELHVVLRLVHKRERGVVTGAAGPVPALADRAWRERHDGHGRGVGDGARAGDAIHDDEPVDARGGPDAVPEARATRKPCGIDLRPEDLVLGPLREGGRTGVVGLGALGGRLVAERGVDHEQAERSAQEPREDELSLGHHGEPAASGPDRLGADRPGRRHRRHKAAERPSGRSFSPSRRRPSTRGSWRGPS